MDFHDITSNHSKFILYLETTSYRFKSEEEKENLVNFAEEQIPAFLQANGIKVSRDLYANRDKSLWIDVVRNRIPTDTEEQKEHAHRMLEAIKYYEGFLKFDKTANYREILAKKIKHEQKKSSTSSGGGSIEIPDNSQPEDEGSARPEGFVSQVFVTKYERNAEDRKKALAKYGYICQVCHMNFEKRYGEIGHEFIEVHHLYPVCNMGEEYHFDPLDEEKGLVPLCSNRHSMIHRGGHFEIQNGERVMVPMTLNALKTRYNSLNPLENER